MKSEPMRVILNGCPYCHSDCMANYKGRLTSCKCTNIACHRVFRLLDVEPVKTIKWKAQD
jgi:hypothetical protein